MATQAMRSKSSKPYSSAIYIISMMMTCVVLVLSTSVGCDELSKLLGEDCEESASVLNDILKTEGQLTTDLPEEGPYPMSMIVSQDLHTQTSTDYYKY